MSKPTVEQAQALQAMFDHFNDALFLGVLPGDRVICTWTRAHQIVAGFLAPRRWSNSEGGHVYELAINANLMRAMSTTDLCAVMVHEMLHLEEVEAGTAGRAGYHKAAYCDRLRALGITPTDPATNKPLDPGTGAQAVAQVVLDDPSTPFRQALDTLPEEAIPPYDSDPEEGMPQDQGGGGQGEEGQPQEGDAGTPTPAKPRPGTRARFTCPACGLNAWAKHGANLVCGGASCNYAAMLETTK
jgi:hypothetical protein